MGLSSSCFHIFLLVFPLDLYIFFNENNLLNLSVCKAVRNSVCFKMKEAQI
jgi:hypothetical protein